MESWGIDERFWIELLDSDDGIFWKEIDDIEEEEEEEEEQMELFDNGDVWKTVLETTEVSWKEWFDSDKVLEALL